MPSFLAFQGGDHQTLAPGFSCCPRGQPNLMEVVLKEPSRQVLSNWLYGAECLLCDLTDQVPIPGLEGEVCPNGEPLAQSKLGKEEAHRILKTMCEALGMEWHEFLNPLRRAWSKRRKAKAKRLGWYPPGEMMKPRKESGDDQAVVDSDQVLTDRDSKLHRSPGHQSPSHHSGGNHEHFHQQPGPP